MCYIKSLFDSPPLLFGSVFFGIITSFLFSETFVFTATISMIIMIGLDALTRLYAQSRKSGGFIKAIKNKSISSRKLFDGTIEKLVILGVLLIMRGCAYMLSPISLPAQVLTYGFFFLMFGRDLTSIFENLIDAGCHDIVPFKKFADKKISAALDNLTPSISNDVNESTESSEDAPI